MSAAIYARLLDEFRQGWLDLRDQLFTIEVLSPGTFCGGGDPKFNTINYDKQVGVGSVCLPFQQDGAESTSAVVVMTKRELESQIWLPSPEAIDRFERLCAEAGAALPLVIRSGLARYHTWATERNPANWWLSVLVAREGFTVYDADGQYQKRQLITNPWQASLDAIEHLQLNTDAPGWPEETLAAIDQEHLADLVEFNDVRKLLGIGAERLHNVASKWRKDGRTINWPANYAELRPLIIAQWPKKATLFPESYAEFQKILAARKVS